MDVDDRLRLDYEHTTDLLRTLTDIRFKLLAFVPTIAGASVGLVGHPRPAADLLGVGLLGLVATIGIVLYELRNSQLYAAGLRHTRELERELGIRTAVGAARPAPTLRLAGLVPVHQVSGLALVYGVALAGWTYLVAWGALKAAGVGAPRTVGGIIAIVVGVLAIGEIARVLREEQGPGSHAQVAPS
jgi:hypothetical protein